jgi:hypothetical protein
MRKWWESFLTTEWLKISILSDVAGDWIQGSWWRWWCLGIQFHKRSQKFIQLTLHVRQHLGVRRSQLCSINSSLIFDSLLHQLKFAFHQIQICCSRSIYRRMIITFLTHFEVQFNPGLSLICLKMSTAIQLKNWPRDFTPARSRQPKLDVQLFCHHRVAQT